MLGKGGMGVVYGIRCCHRSQSCDQSDHQSVLDADELKHVMERFGTRRRQSGGSYPRIVQIYDYGEDDEVAYIVMELVKGKTLHEHLTQEVKYEIREVGTIVRHLLDGIGHAHSEGVVHRDIKPSNIMINDDGRIKISDFGIARIDSSNLTQVGDVLGTPHYMAPEQFLGTEIDALADLFSIGVIAYELLTGRKPFTGNTATVMQQVLNEQPPDPSQLNAKLSPLMDRVLHKASPRNAKTVFRARANFDAFAALEITLNADAGRARRPTSGALLSAARLLNVGPVAATGTPCLS